MALDPAVAESRLKEALGECRNRNFEKGKELLESLLAQDPENYKALNALGKVFLILKESDHALGCFLKAVSIRPDFSEAMVNAARVHYDAGNYADARNFYQRVVENEPKNADGHFGLGNVYRRQEKYKDAIKSYNDALQLNPKDAQAYINLGLCHYKDTNYHDATYNFMMALELGGDNRKAFMNLALCLEKQDRWSEAASNWTRFIDMNPKGEELEMAITHLQECRAKF